jgi:hypothetical protein
MEGHEIKAAPMWRLLIAMAFFCFPCYSAACSCIWKGPFLEIYKDAPLVFHGRIIRHHPGRSPAMDVLVLETLKGGILDSGMTVQMGDGMHCRPSLESFPPGTEWILALNGPGAKPGSGWALSHCGEYWLQVEKGQVIGSIHGAQSQVNRMPLGELRRKLTWPRFSERFPGHVVKGKRFSRPFGARFTFILEPRPGGWEIFIREYGREENLARLTPPFHSAPNPREIEGWHLSEDPFACASRPYTAPSGPENPRKFIFSPEVGKRIDGPNAGRRVAAEEVEEIERFGRGTLAIGKFRLEPGKDGCPEIGDMDFSVEVEGGY